MKIALEYRRISNEDQSNFSLSGQDKINREYAEKHNIKIIKTYIDDGYSAKNFDRPDWRKLEADLSKNRGTIDYLIVSKYDRLIRNAAEGLAFIEKLEEKWNIKLLSVMENFFIDPHSPFFFKMRADMLVNAEFERRVISDRSRFGLWSAKSQGRFIGRAPLGYINGRDGEDKPIILVDDNKKGIVKKIFHDFLDDVPFPEIIKRAKDNGFSLKGHDALKRLLLNNVYVGQVSVKSYKDNIAKVVKGIHQPIIPEDIFWRANQKLTGKIRPQGRIVDEKIPLRGYIVCEHCGHPHTGAKSKGKLAYYYYYWCKRCKVGQRHSATKTHDEIAQILNFISLDERMLVAIKEQSLQELDVALKQRKKNSGRVMEQFNEIKTKLNSLEEKYITDSISRSTYEKWHSIYSADLNLKNVQLIELNKNEDEKRALFENEIHKLSDMNYIYNSADVIGKHSLLRNIFPEYLAKEKIGCRTPSINKVFISNIHKTVGLLRITETGNPGFMPKFPVSRGNGNEVEHLLLAISNIFKAA